MSTERFDNAVRKLYTAFHEGTLNAFDCEACAVGNIVGHGGWEGHWTESYFESGFGSILAEFVWSIPIIRFYEGSNTSGYSDVELFVVERKFLEAHLGCRTTEKFQSTENKEAQYNGLIAVVKYLAELDGIEWPDYTKLFEYNEQGAVYEL